MKQNIPYSVFQGIKIKILFIRIIKKLIYWSRCHIFNFLPTLKQGKFSINKLYVISTFKRNGKLIVLC